MAITLKPENVARLVFFVRGEKVMLDTDLARLYRVTTGNLNKAAKRSLIFQLGRSKGRGGRRTER
jgi:hypothetical protein